MPTSSRKAPRGHLAQLSPNEEITLRRVAVGESPVATLRARDLVQLRRLRLVVDGKDGPQLTPAGRRRFDGLPGAMLRADAGPRDLLSVIVRSVSASRGKPE